MNNIYNEFKNEELFLKGDKKPEIFIIGQIDYGKNFKTNDGLCCDFLFDYNEEWNFLSNNNRFQTHTVYENNTGYFNWSHSFELYMSPNKIINWPKIILRVWRLDFSNNTDWFSIGEILLPTKEGYNEIVCSTWRPFKGFQYSNIEALMENSPKLTLDEEETKSFNDYKKIGNTSGDIYINLEIVYRNLSFN